MVGESPAGTSLPGFGNVLVGVATNGLADGGLTAKQIALLVAHVAFMLGVCLLLPVLRPVPGVENEAGALPNAPALLIIESIRTRESPQGGVPCVV